MTFLKNMKMLFLFIAVPVIIVAIGFGLYHTMIAVAISDYIRFAIELIVFGFIVWGCELGASWKKAGMFVVSICALFCSFIDILGNSLLNKPLVLLYGGSGDPIIRVITTTVVGRSVKERWLFEIMNSSGELVKTVGLFPVYMMRLLEYILLFSLLLTIMYPIFSKIRNYPEREKALQNKAHT